MLKKLNIVIKQGFLRTIFSLRCRISYKRILKLILANANELYKNYLRLKTPVSILWYSYILQCTHSCTKDSLTFCCQYVQSHNAVSEKVPFDLSITFSKITLKVHNHSLLNLWMNYLTYLFLSFQS